MNKNLLNGVPQTRTPSTLAVQSPLGAHGAPAPSHVVMDSAPAIGLFSRPRFRYDFGIRYYLAYVLVFFFLGYSIARLLYYSKVGYGKIMKSVPKRC